LYFDRVAHRATGKSINPHLDNKAQSTKHKEQRTKHKEQSTKLNGPEPTA